MSRMGDFIIECGELYAKRHPGVEWEEIMEIITSDNDESEAINNEVLAKYVKGEQS